MSDIVVPPDLHDMSMIGKIAIGLVGLLHVYILILEMFLWTKPAGLRAFRLTPEQAQSSRVLAMNQGLYNGFLAAGLFWSLLAGEHGFMIAIFFLTCVIVAGIFGGITAGRKIIYVQALPALVALILLHIR